MTAAAERGVDVPFERALEIMTNPQTPMSFTEQQAFEFSEPVALAGQTFTPGERTTGQMRTLRTGEQRGQRAEDLLERYSRENVGGLTPKGRQSAGAQRLRGIEEQDEPRAVLTTPTGRTMRNISALDPEALASGEIEYSSKTFETTGSDPEQAAKIAKEVSSGNYIERMNSLFGPETRIGDIHLKLEKGIKPMGAKHFYNQISPIAHDVFDRAANYYAGLTGVELPNKEVDYIGYLKAANSVLYKNKDIAKESAPLMAKAFNQGLRERGYNLAVANDPALAVSALNTLMGVARRTTKGDVGLRHFSNLASRAASRGLIRASESLVPVGVPGLTEEQKGYVQEVMKQAGVSQPRLTPPLTGF